MQLRGTSHQRSHSRRMAWLHTDRPSTRQRGLLVVFSVARGSDAGPGGRRRRQRRRPSPARRGFTLADRPLTMQRGLLVFSAARGSDAGAGGRWRRQRRRPLPLRGSDTPTDWPSTRQRGLLVFSPRHVALMPVPAVDCDVNGGVLLLRGAASHRPTGL